MGRFFIINDTNRSNWGRFCLLVTWLAILIVCQATPVHASVTLEYFDAEALSGMVRLRWETASELQNAGFYIQRSDQEFGTYLTISPFIASTGDDLVGAQYSYDDSNVSNGQPYWYRLEAIDVEQNSDYYGPVQATPGVLSTVTPTLTPTTTATWTPTLTQSADSQPTGTATSLTTTPSTNTVTPSPTSNLTQSPTPTPNRFIPTSTRTVSPAYPAPVTTDTPEVNLSSTPGVVILPDQLTPTSPIASATLIPLPSITFIFPEQDETTSESATPEVDDQSGKDTIWDSPQSIVLISAIGLIWVILASWVFIAIRRMG